MYHCAVSGPAYRWTTVLLLLAMALPLPAVARASEPLWTLLKGGGQVVLLRHASTPPAMGDPPGFRLDDCATQRNLSAIGREESRRIGAAFTTRGIPVDRVLSSPWCRCLETARLAFGAAEPGGLPRMRFYRPGEVLALDDWKRAELSTAAGVGR